MTKITLAYLRRLIADLQAAVFSGITDGDRGDVVVSGGGTVWTIDSNFTAALLLTIYPVGCIYESVNSANPSTLFGGTWEAFGSGRVTVGFDAGQTEFNSVEKTGGAKTHTLSVDEMPSHTHVQDAHTHDVGSANDLLSDLGDSHYFAGNTSTVVSSSTTATNQNTGGGQAHNNLQPYIVTYKFKHTA